MALTQFPVRLYLLLYDQITTSFVSTSLAIRGSNLLPRLSSVSLHIGLGFEFLRILIFEYIIDVPALLTF